MGCKHCKILLGTSNQSNKDTVNIDVTSKSISKIAAPGKRSKLRQIKLSTIDVSLFPTLDNLPVELIYHILDRLDTQTIFTSLYNVCTRLNSVLRTYSGYNLNLASISQLHFNRICSFIRPEQIRSLTLSDGNENVRLVEIFFRKFHLNSLTQLQSLKLVNIDNSDEMIRILLSLNDRLKMLTIENTTENYTDVVIDTLTTLIGTRTLEKVCLDLQKGRFLNPNILWPEECFITDIKLVCLCNIGLFRDILLYSSHLKKFEAYDIDFDDEWIDNDDDNGENAQRDLVPIPNASNLSKLSLIYARNEMEKLEWLLPQFTKLNYFKYLNIYDFHIESMHDCDYLLLNGRRWEKLICNCQKFEFIFTISLDEESWIIQNFLDTFQTEFWRQRNCSMGCEEYEKTLLVYSLPYAHDSHYFDRVKISSIPSNLYLSNKSWENVTKLRINMAALTSLSISVFGRPRFYNVSQLILDGQWRDPDAVDLLSSLVCLSHIEKLIRLERVPTLIFRTFLYRLTSLKSLTLTTFVLDSMNAANLQYFRCLHSLNVLQVRDDHSHFVHVEPFCTMFPYVEHLDVPIDTVENCQYVIDRLGQYLISSVFRFPHHDNSEDNDEDDDDDDDGDGVSSSEDRDNKHQELIDWAENLQSNHQYRINDGDICLWLR